MHFTFTTRRKTSHFSRPPIGLQSRYMIMAGFSRDISSRLTDPDTAMQLWASVDFAWEIDDWCGLEDPNLRTPF